MPKPTILVIDDDAGIRESLKMTLEYEGYAVIGAATALEAMDADVTRVLYAELGHAVNEDELEHVRGMMRRLAAESGASS